jgi:hydroxymethylbilane synthase
MNRIMTIGTRESELARWQANKAAGELAMAGYKTSVSYIKSDGDIDITTPLYKTGVVGIFTKTLDIALLEKRIDIAVHSYKDVPTSLPEGLQVAAVLKRGNPFDVLVCKNEKAKEDIYNGNPLTIATSSIRRRAQWLHKYKNSRVENIRGNVQTRLQKLQASSWQGTILAAAGLERLELASLQTGPQLQLHWMLPAPAQGAIVIVCREDDHDIISACSALNDEATQICTAIERDFLRVLQGGCSTPISALATLDDQTIYFKGNITTPNGEESKTVMVQGNKKNYAIIAESAIHEIAIDHNIQLLMR